MVPMYPQYILKLTRLSKNNLSVSIKINDTKYGVQKDFIYDMHNMPAITNLLRASKYCYIILIIGIYTYNYCLHKICMKLMFLNFKLGSYLLFTYYTLF